MTPPKIPKKVLVCDDDPEIVGMLDMILRHNGYQCIPVLNSAEVFTVIDQQHPDIILLDLWMPALPGDVILQKLKGEPATQHLPVFLISASPEGQAIANRFHADEFIGKPFMIKDLLQKIEAVVN